MRYIKTKMKNLLHSQYSSFMARRGKSIWARHYEMPVFHSLTQEQLADISEINHTWTLGDRYYKLAQTYYDTPEAWWVIALYNGQPTEAHIGIGTTIYIPTPVGKVMAYYGY